MFPSLPPRWLILYSLLTASAAEAQTGPVRPAPQSPAPLLSYQSVFDGYQALTDDKPTPWKEANETAALRGGWLAYAKEAGSAGDAPGADHAGHSMPLSGMPGMPGMTPKKETP